MTRSVLSFAALVSSALLLAGCGDEGIVGQEGETITPTTGVATPTEEPESFETHDADPLTTNEISGDIVEDPGMDVSYKWQGTSSAPNGGTVVTVAVTNHSDNIMPPEALGEPELKYQGGKEKASRISAEDAGLEIDGLDLPLGKGATMNVQYVFDVSMGNLGDATFKIGNVIFEGNLNN
ncbi:hypothetical protein [uncultured Corynebacterium sp.]|uniref:hypothetical protein n=1 Tax=uncultured Corynebacterium sp. TaxID=159447 RepID=UPI00260707A8|nr:hypothetical protein [uncultured Corynebacterium sp.]